jgi:hypothetical protein
MSLAIGILLTLGGPVLGLPLAALAVFCALAILVP